MTDSEKMAQLAPWLAFAGNSLLAPPSQTKVVGLMPDFWSELAESDDAGIAAAAQELEAYARMLCEGNKDVDGCAPCGNDEAAVDVAHGLRPDEKMLQRVSVEYAHLFVGPPKPAVAPWETFYRQPGCAVGFGAATAEMRTELHACGLTLAQAGRQYEDHMGIELLLLSELCLRAGDAPAAAEKARDFAKRHPLSWASELSMAVERERPNGYYARMVALAEALLAAIAA